MDQDLRDKRPVLAICYDFDKTLSPHDMQEDFIRSVGYQSVSDFWRECDAFAKENCMDANLAYMFKMKAEAEGQEVFTAAKLREYGAQVELYPGVEDWFERVREYGARHGIRVEHYIISSGLKEMIEGTSLYKCGTFERVYANSFYYNDRGVAVWPAQVVNYTNKTQYLFRIEKGVLDYNDSRVNDYCPPDQLHVPFRNMVYIGDSDTDIPCMKLVNINGGYSIGIHNGNKEKVQKMMRDQRIRYYASADYREGTELDCLIQAIIDRTEATEKLETVSRVCIKESGKNI